MFTKLSRQHMSLAAAGHSLGPLSRAWYSGVLWPKLLWPAGWLFARYAARRRLRYRTGKLTSWRAPVPVIVVGNITAGGTGKTPLVIWLAGRLRAMGYRPGIVSGGYGGHGAASIVTVEPATSTDIAGDEAPLLAARTACPVVVCGQRARAVESAVVDAGCDIVIADDGLQHYALARDIEIAVIDGHRGVGNGLPLPAGPLREPLARLTEVDWVVSSGVLSGCHDGESLMRAVPLRFVSVNDPAIELSCEAFTRRQVNVNAVAGIGNPARFVSTLRDMGLAALLHAYPDHHRFTGGELAFDNGWPVVCTEKDATKIRELANVPGELWYLEIAVELQPVDGVSADTKLEALLNAHGAGQR